MKPFVSKSLLLTLLAAFLSFGFIASDDGEDKVWVVQINPKYQPSREDCYLPKYEGKKVAISYSFENPLFQVGDEFGGSLDVAMDEKLLEADCFIPSVKLVYREYTYVLSDYCTSVMKLKNSAPYVTSNVQLPNDFVFTESMLFNLEKIEQRYFKSDRTKVFSQLALLVKPTYNQDIESSDMFSYSLEDAELDANIGIDPDQEPVNCSDMEGQVSNDMYQEEVDQSDLQEIETLGVDMDTTN